MAIVIGQLDYELIKGRKPWFVNGGAANDTGDGTTPATAKKYLASVVALAASGDDILIKGTCTEADPGGTAAAVDASTKELRFIGQGRSSKVTSAASHTIFAGNNSEFENLAVYNTKYGFSDPISHGYGSAVYAPVSGIRVKGCIFNGSGNGLSNDSAGSLFSDEFSHWYIDDSLIIGTEYAVQCCVNHLTIRHSNIIAGTMKQAAGIGESMAIKFASASPEEVPYFTLGGYHLTLDNCHIHNYSVRNYSSGLYTQGIYMDGGALLANNSLISVTGTGTDSLCGIYGGVAGYMPLVCLNGTSIITYSSGGGVCKDIVNAEANDFSSTPQVWTGLTLPIVVGHNTRTDRAKLSLNGAKAEVNKVVDGVMTMVQ